MGRNLQYYPTVKNRFASHIAFFGAAFFAMIATSNVAHAGDKKNVVVGVGVIISKDTKGSKSSKETALTRPFAQETLNLKPLHLDASTERELLRIARIEDPRLRVIEAQFSTILEAASMITDSIDEHNSSQNSKPEGETNHSIQFGMRDARTLEIGENGITIHDPKWRLNISPKFEEKTLRVGLAF